MSNQGKVKTYAVDVRHVSEVINHNGQVTKFEQWRQVGMTQASRAGTAIRTVERLLPGKMVRVRLLTSSFAWRTFEPSVRVIEAGTMVTGTNTVEDLAAVLRFSAGGQS